MLEVILKRLLSNLSYLPYINEFTLFKQIQITCLRLKIYGIKPVSVKINVMMED